MPVEVLKVMEKFIRQFPVFIYSPEGLYGGGAPIKGCFGSSMGDK